MLNLKMDILGSRTLGKLTGTVPILSVFSLAHIELLSF